MIDPTWRDINRLFILSIKNGDNDCEVLHAISRNQRF